MTWKEIKYAIDNMSENELNSEALIQLHSSGEVYFQNISLKIVNIKENYETAYSEYLFDYNIPDGKVSVLSIEE